MDLPKRCKAQQNWQQEHIGVKKCYNHKSHQAASNLLKTVLIVYVCGVPSNFLLTSHRIPVGQHWGLLSIKRGDLLLLSSSLSFPFSPFTTMIAYTIFVLALALSAIASPVARNNDGGECPPKQLCSKCPRKDNGGHDLQTEIGDAHYIHCQYQDTDCFYGPKSDVCRVSFLLLDKADSTSLPGRSTRFRLPCQCLPKSPNRIDLLRRRATSFKIPRHCLP